MKHQRGFSIIEVILILALLAILVTFAIPQFNNWVSTSEVAVEKYTLGNIEEGLHNLYARNMAYGTANQGSDYPANPFNALDIKPNYVPFAEFDWTTKNRWSYQVLEPGPSTGSGYILHTRNNGDTYYINYRFQNSIIPGVASTFQIVNTVDGSKDMRIWGG